MCHEMQRDHGRHGMSRTAAVSRSVLMALACLLPGCIGYGNGIPSILELLSNACFVAGCFAPPCVNNVFVEVNDTTTPMVPDQDINGCIGGIYVNRTFGSDFGRELIQRAEDLASTAGPSWVSATKQPSIVDANGDPAFLIVDAVTSEAIAYYAKRVLSLQTSTNPGLTRNGLCYTAGFVGQYDPVPDGAMRTLTVRLELGYSEGDGQHPSNGVDAWREVEFDTYGELIEIRGDGEATVY
jgi:hypothetical protein